MKKFYIKYLHDNRINNNLRHIITNTSKHEILEDYLEIYLQTNKGKKELNFQDYSDKTPLMLASEFSNSGSSIRTVKILIDNNANIDLQDMNGMTALMYASRIRRSTETVKLLIENGANVNLEDEFSQTALTHASLNSIETVKLLIDNGANVNFQNKNGKTTLMFVSDNLYTHYPAPLETVKLLIEKGANVNLQNNIGWTALMYASNSCSIDKVKLLIENNADIYIQNENGDTALIIALKNGKKYNSIKNSSIEVVKLLINHDPNINL